MTAVVLPPGLTSTMTLIVGLSGVPAALARMTPAASVTTSASAIAKMNTRRLMEPPRTPRVLTRPPS